MNCLSISLSAEASQSLATRALIDILYSCRNQGNPRIENPHFSFGTRGPISPPQEGILSLSQESLSQNLMVFMNGLKMKDA